jgi:carbamoyl-phosphate synthase large subunit
MTKIMVTGGGSLCGQGIIKSLRMGPRVHIVAVDPDPDNAVGCHWADSAHPVPLASADDYLDAIIETIEHEKPDIVMIGTDVELPVLAKYRNDIEIDHGSKVLVSSPEVIAIADDKYRTYEFMRDAGFFPPKTSYFVHEAQNDTLVVKPRIGGRSRGVSVVTSTEQLIREMQADGMIHQEYIDGPEYTAGAVYFGGEVATIVMRRELRDGNTYRAYVEEFPELNAKVREWTLALKPWGPVNFQFRVDAKGEPRCFEINARFSGTTPMRAMAGFNEVRMCVDFLLHGRPITKPHIKPMKILRYWSELAVTK